MTDFRVLTDTDVKSLLQTSDPKEISRFAQILTDAFHTYSTTDEAKYQPERAGVKRPSGQGTLFMPSTSPSHLGVKVVGLPPPQSKPEHQPSKSQTSTPKPATLETTMLLCESNGRATGVLNAGALTAFRTSLGAMLPFRARHTVQNVVMFGSGKQAYWHLRLAAILRGADIVTMTIVNRSASRAKDLVETLREDDVFKSQYPHIEIKMLTPDDEGYEQSLKKVVQTANSIHCAVPSTEPLFPAEWVRGRKDLYVSAIGSYRLDMQELDPRLLKDVVADSGSYVVPGRATPVVLVDSRSACFEEAGEVVAAGLKAEHVLEAGELAGLLQKEEKGGREGLEEWLATGLVVYKSVGFGVMDLCVGTALFELAREKGVGSTVPNFW